MILRVYQLGQRFHGLVYDDQGRIRHRVFPDYGSAHRYVEQFAAAYTKVELIKL